MAAETSNKFRAVIFDLDGTLAYTVEDLKNSMNRMLTEYNCPPRTTAEILGCISFIERDFVKYSLPEAWRDDCEQVEKCRQTYAAIYDAHFLDQTVLYPGMEELLKQMKEAGIRMAVNTNKLQRQANAIVDKLAPGIFEMLKGDGYYPSKPDPTGALEIASAFGVDPSEICYVGDSNVDMQTAVNAGMFPIGVKWGYRPDVLMESGAKALVASAEELAAWFAL